MQKIKEFWQNMQKKTKQLLLIIGCTTILVVVVAIAALRAAENANYSTLFTDLNQEEAQEIVGLLQEDGVSYQYSDTDGTIRVLSTKVDTLRAELLSAGYPQSGFTYDMYIDNAGLMTTESDKKQYTLYELQDRLGAQIRLFEGVKDAKVTIATAQEKVYALQDDSQSEASASVVVTMNAGEKLTKEKASAVKNLIARAIRGMNFTNVAVFDAATMTEVSDDSADSDYGNGESMVELTALVENNIAANIRRVLGQLYENDKIAVSVKGTLNMDRLIQENVVYSVPDQVDEEDRSGLLYYENTAGENSGTVDETTGGVAGADANADTPRYTYEAGEDGVVDAYSSNSATREWLFNTLTEQREVSPGVLENTTVSVVINTDDMSVPQQSLVNLVANAAGISSEDADEKITIVRAMGDKLPEESLLVSTEPADPDDSKVPSMLPIIIAAAAAVLLLLLLIILLIIRRKRRKKKAEDIEDLTVDPFDMGPVRENQPSISDVVQQLDEEDSEMMRNEEILNLRMQRNLKLKQNIGEFVDQNPQVAAKLLQGWLRGEGADNGGKRKQSGGPK